MRVELCKVAIEPRGVGLRHNHRRRRVELLERGAPVEGERRRRRRRDIRRHKVEQGRRRRGGGGARGGGGGGALEGAERELSRREAQPVRGGRLHVGAQRELGEAELHRGARNGGGGGGSQQCVVDGGPGGHAREVSGVVDGGFEGGQRQAELRARQVVLGGGGVHLGDGGILGRRRVQRTDPRRVELEPHRRRRRVARQPVRAEELAELRVELERRQLEQRRLARHGRRRVAALRAAQRDAARGARRRRRLGAHQLREAHRRLGVGVVRRKRPRLAVDVGGDERRLDETRERLRPRLVGCATGDGLHAHRTDAQLERAAAGVGDLLRPHVHAARLNVQTQRHLHATRRAAHVNTARRARSRGGARRRRGEVLLAQRHFDLVRRRLRPGCRLGLVFALALDGAKLIFVEDENHRRRRRRRQWRRWSRRRRRRGGGGSCGRRGIRLAQ